MNLKTFKRMTVGRKTPILAAAVGILALAAVACSSTAANTPTPSGVGTDPVNTNIGLPAGSTGGSGVSIAPSIGASSPGFTEASFRDSGAFAPTTSVYNNGQTGQVGIWVTGTGTKEVASDVAKVFLGVESKEETVREARQNAAEAMTAVLDAIRDLGVADDDIVTTSFNIYPQTVWIEVNDSLGRHSEPRITGYTVNNSVEVTVRDIDLLDEVIDSAAERGGDLIRVNSVSFTVSNPALHGAETRQLAAADARAKAQLYADAMGVNLGPLMFLTELGSSAPLAQSREFAADASFAEAGFAPTPFQSGEVNLSTTIQAAFAIAP